MKLNTRYVPTNRDEALVVRRALALVRNGAVESYTYDSSGETVVATINGVETADVRLVVHPYEC